MDLHITQDELVRALASVQGVVERRSTHQILSNAHLTAASGELQVMATDTELTLVSRHPAQVSREGVATVHAGHIFQVAKTLPTGAVHVVLEAGHQLVVDAPPAHFRIMGLAPEDFPAFPAIDPISTLKVQASALRRVIDQTVFAIPVDDQRYGLNGGHLESVESPEGESRIRLVTTDGSRLCYAEAAYGGTFGMGRHMLLPRKALTELRKLLDRDEEVEIVFGDRAATFQVGRSLLHTRLVDGEFPAYRSVLPKTHLRRVEVERGPLLDALRRVSLEAMDQSNTVRMNFGPDQVLLSARSADHGEANHPVPVHLEGDSILMGFNVRFFLDVVSCLEDDTLVFELGEALSPCVVRPRDRDDALFIVMPIRLE